MKIDPTTYRAAAFSMSDLPELIVDGDPADWLPIPHSRHGLNDTIRVDGDGTTVTCQQCDGEGAPLPRETFPNQRNCRHCDGHGTRPLRAGDRVTLATECGFCGQQHNYTHPFATATVNQIRWVRDAGDWVWLVTVTDVQSLEES